jgi:hypothetical protein
MLWIISSILLVLSQIVRCSRIDSKQIVEPHEKFLGGLASLLQIERETVTITEQAKYTLSLESIIRVTETTVDYRTRTISSTITTTNTIWDTFSTEITKHSTTYETELTTRTDEIVIRVTSTITETLRVQLNLCLETQMLPPQNIIITTLATQTVLSTQSDIRTIYENQTNIRTTTFTRHSIYRFTEYETRTEVYTSTIKETVRQPRIKTVSKTFLIGSTQTVTATTTLYNQQHHYGRIPGVRARH